MKGGAIRYGNAARFLRPNAATVARHHGRLAETEAEIGDLLAATDWKVNLTPFLCFWDEADGLKTVG